MLKYLLQVIHLHSYFVTPKYKDKNYTKSSKLRITEDSLQLEDDTSPDYKLREEIGLTQLQKIFHKQYAQKLDDYELKISQIERLEQEVANTKKPVLFTEGKTDVVILNTAWEKLDSTVEKPFEILPVESTEIDGGDGGYSSLNRKLESVRKDEKLQIGIYDNDEAGNSKGFQKLNKNFIMYNNNPFIKIHKNNRAIAIILPIPKGLDEFAKHKNLQIEFYFNEVVINKKINGKGLLLEPFQFNLPFRGETIETIVRTEIYLSKINSDTKKYFSEVIVPSLDKESFINFKPLFEIICSLILKYQN
jgi:hypothetical protein